MSSMKLILGLGKVTTILLLMVINYVLGIKHVKSKRQNNLKSLLKLLMLPILFTKLMVLIKLLKIAYQKSNLYL